jgi:hypothetical protein
MTAHRSMFVCILGLTVLLLLMSQLAYADSVSLSGLHLFGLDASGNLQNPTGGSTTYVPNSGNYVLWVAPGNMNAQFINGPNRDDAAISVALDAGSYTFFIFTASGCSEGQSIFPCAPPQFGLNLFFNGNQDIPRRSSPQWSYV